MKEVFEKTWSKTRRMKEFIELNNKPVRSLSSKQKQVQRLLMSPQNDFILKGPAVGPIPDCSLGEYLIQKVKSIPQDQIIQVDADTGKEQTIGELLNKSIRLSEGLKKLGLKENDVVGMLCRNCFEASEIVLATWLSGAPIAPICGAMKVDEIKHFLKLTKPKYTFCDEEALGNATAALNLLSISSLVILVPKTKKSNYSHLTLQEVLIDVDVERYKPQPVKSPATQLASILPSSGTSGLPKEVGLTHKNLIFQDINMELICFFNFKMDSLQISHFFWITGILTFLKSLTAGMKRILLRDPNEINVLKAIEQYKPKWSIMAPLFALSVANHSDFEKFDKSSMEVLIVGGSPFTPSMGEKLMEKWERVRFMQGYGATEVSGWVSSTDESQDIYSVGKLLPGLQLKVIDTMTGKSMKSNRLGEIWVKSPGIMLGYFGNEEATREAVDAEGWFHTGDLGYYDDLGQVYLVDRLKEMIKVMNMQVAPAELENAILSIPGVLEAGVVGVTHDGNLFELLALVVKEKNSTVTEGDIHSHIASTLSDYKKLTGGIYFVESLPKTASGKLQRKEIRKMAQTLYSKICN